MGGTKEPQEKTKRIRANGSATINLTLKLEKERRSGEGKVGENMKVIRLQPGTTILLGRLIRKMEEDEKGRKTKKKKC